MTKTIIEIIAVALSALTCFIGGLRFLNSRFDQRFGAVQQALAAQGKELQVEVTQRYELSSRLQVIEAKMDALPTNDDINQVHRELAQLHATVSAEVVRSKATAEGVRRIEDFLLNKART